MFMVFRGNYSEGKDFPNDFCRGLIIIGVPNLNIEDPNLKLKEFFYDNKEKIENFLDPDYT